MPAARILHFPKVSSRAKPRDLSRLFFVFPASSFRRCSSSCHPERSRGTSLRFPAVIPNPSVQFADGGERFASYCRFFFACGFRFKVSSRAKSRDLSSLFRPSSRTHPRSLRMAVRDLLPISFRIAPWSCGAEAQERPVSLRFLQGCGFSSVSAPLGFTPRTRSRWGTQVQLYFLRHQGQFLFPRLALI